ncbi:DUF4269 domain-containing protein [Anaeromicrobium sediminis]|uniref:DUF4269 domain-containing protein n=1 Tax=Anaeromicrobium sediminis TaxID=1478221 RepID=A0A267MNE7_9FIRM|nr:DUF4269 domain-containing protein [Anaeromicrobium sediminis]PAB60448.1 hypothetical protein CCE28_06010 [Anaeromicrobium sediminis]
MLNRWKDISYLLNGNNKQQKAYEVLNNIKIFNILEKYHPILVGTIPIEIDTENSDLDIICEVYDFHEFEELVIAKFKYMEGFKIHKEDMNLVVNFKYDGFEIEIFAQSLETHKQNAYVHMIIEDRILKIAGVDFKNEILKLKEDGVKTEPAFAKCVNLEGNPYIELLKLYSFSDEEILGMINLQ